MTVTCNNYLRYLSNFPVNFLVNLFASLEESIHIHTGNALSLINKAKVASQPRLAFSIRLERRRAP
jgi:hypothetical protein